MVIKRYFVFISALIALAGCGNSQQDDNAEIPEILSIKYDLSDRENAVSSIIDSLSFIPLYGSVDHPVAHVDDLQITSDGFFILDQQHNIIHAYSPTGDFLYQIDATGNGPGEYAEIACFCVSDSAIYTVDNYKKKIFQYNITDGKFICDFDAPIIVGGIRSLKRGGFILCEHPGEGALSTEYSNGNRIFKTDRDFNISGSMYPYGKGKDRISMPQLIKGGDGYITYASCSYNGFTIINPDDGSIEGNVAVITDKPYNPDAVAGMKGSEALDFIDREGYKFLTLTPVMTDSHVAFTIKDQQSGNVCVYNKKTQKTYYNSTDNYHNLFLSPHGVFENCFYTVYNFGPDFLDAQLEHGFNRPPHMADSIIRKEGTVLLRYTMKE